MMNTQSRRKLFAAGLITAALANGAIAQQDEKLGKVVFPTSCDPNVQAEFDRGVAMLHSYWFLIARRKFEGILQQDSTCAMAYWGVAMDYLGNTLATTPTRAESQAAWDALEKARATGLVRSQQVCCGDRVGEVGMRGDGQTAGAADGLGFAVQDSGHGVAAG